MILVGPGVIAAELGLPAPTPEQADVIAAPPEPALVVAGAGAGKTETMAARVVWLVANGIVAPDRVLGLTFTRKAARQLSDRVRARLRRLAGSKLLDRVDPTGARRHAVQTSEPTVLTYHAYAGRIVAEHGLRLPVEPGARLLTETASWQIAHHVVSTWNDDIDTDKVPATITSHVLRIAGELAEHLVEPDAIRDHAERLATLIEEAPRGPKQSDALSKKLQDIVAAQRFRVALLPLVEAYAQAKRRLGALDFADQMALAATIARDYPEVVAGERERYGAVLLDEYQDTGHAQRVLLRSLFGAGDPLPVTAVGDPAQAIYGWRGASAANLPRFTTDFPRVASDRTTAPAARYGLLTSFRNPAEVLELANLIAHPLRRAGLDVDDLRSRDDAPPGDVVCALHADVHAERAWLAEAVKNRWQAGIDEHGTPPTAAVLVRRRADMADIAAALREVGLPVEVVGIGGLLAEPEIRDLVSTLRLLVDPLAGTAAMRLLTNSRWRVGAADLAALWRRAAALGGVTAKSEVDGLLAVVADAMPIEHSEQTGLADALDDPGDPTAYSVAGFRRIADLGDELAALRRRLDAPLPELVAEVERTLMLDIEAMARPGGIGRVHLDAFADVVAEFAAASPSATLPALLDYLGVAEREEDGLTPGEVQVAEDRVQVLTVHAAKGLEWQVVAVPHLVNGVFPGVRRSASWLRTVTELPADLRGDADDLPTLRVPNGSNRKEVESLLVGHDDAFEQRRLIEDRRLCYVALTRSERTLLVSGHWWGETGTRPRGPSPFLQEIHAGIAVSPHIGTVDEWADPPDEDATNPLSEYARTAQWPADPLGERRPGLTEGAELVRAAMNRPSESADDEDGWARDVDVLLAERAAAANRRERVLLPDQLTVSQLVQLAGDHDGLAQRLRRPLPARPNPSARRGTAFHGWLERRFSASRLLDLDELPGAADADDLPADTDLRRLQEAFQASEWGERTPYDVEVPFETELSGITIRGRMDAVFADPDGGWTVVDWKTGALPNAERAPALAVQLAAYRLAWAALSGTDVHHVRAVFHYVAHDTTVRPQDLLDAAGLRALLDAVPVLDNS
ncbi:MAG TPA: ATP-dependent DNA helicase [Pseudonocardiaceae bacterium]|nr:ATP-dependent DNA helicase [Pseudonocardiaceae bacterium]